MPPRHPTHLRVHVSQSTSSPPSSRTPASPTGRTINDMSEKEDLLRKISQVAGQINRHKNQQEGLLTSQPYPTRYSKYNHRILLPPFFPEDSINSDFLIYSAIAPPTRGAPYYGPARGRGRGRGGIITPVHRNRTLILNNNSNTNSSAVAGNEGESQSTTTAGSAASSSTGDIAAQSVGASQLPGGQQWVAKRDRHMQLINSAVYDQQAAARAKAMEATRQEKLRRRSERQKLKLKRFLERTQNNTTSQFHSPDSSTSHEIIVGGDKYRVSAGGNKLVKVSVDTKAVITTPRKAVIGGVTFVRSKSGNLWRSGLVKSNRRSTTQKIAKPCKYFTMTGKCQRGLSCPYTHDPNRVAICPRFLQFDNCPEGDACDLSHSPTPHRVPACVHFLRGHCANSNCRYAHIRVNPAAPICKAFATEGYCEKGGDCTERHVHECPEFDEKGVCSNRKCKLPHIERAGRRRMAAAAAAAASKTVTPNPNQGTSRTADDESPDGDEDSDLSSDDEGEAIDSDDVDSDALSEGEDEESFIQSGSLENNGHEVTQQLDFIRL